MRPLRSRRAFLGLVGAAVSINMLLNGLAAPFAAALMDRFGIRPVVSAALAVMALLVACLTRPLARRPAIRHGLWVLVLVKLITPPFLA